MFTVAIWHIPTLAPSAHVCNWGQVIHEVDDECIKKQVMGGAAEEGALHWSHCSLHSASIDLHWSISLTPCMS